MDPNARIHQALRKPIHATQAAEGPPRLAEAIEYAVFPGGHRIRPRLALAVALAHGDDCPELSDAALARPEPYTSQVAVAAARYRAGGHAHSRNSSRPDRRGLHVPVSA